MTYFYGCGIFIYNIVMKLLPRLAIILIICLVAITLLPAPAQAECVSWRIDLSPESGPPGTEVTVYGQRFEANKPVDIYYDGDRVVEGITTDNKGEFTVTFAVPESCKGHYWVLAEVGSIRGTVEADRQFAVKPGLTVSPQKGPVGTNVTVQGRGFARNEEGIELYFNGKTIESNIRANDSGSWQTSFQIPASTRGEHKIDAEGGVSRLWEVIPATFRVTAEISIDKSSGIAGDTITVTGSRFGPYEKGIKILFGGEAVVTGIKANSSGEWEASFTVPEMPAGEYSVTAEGESTPKEDVGELSFEIKAEIVLSAHEGHVGMDLTVTGRGFAADEEVVIMYDGSQVATVEPDDKGSFEVIFSVPESKYGERLVTAGYDGGNHANAIFTMESVPPPIPALISPASGSRVGLVGKVTPTFKWSEVEDSSGVYYSLQIATGADFTAPFIIVSVADLTGVSYTPAEALPNGTYYWRVQAVDGAENESGWTSAYSFRVGLLPRWGLIAAIAAAVVLFLALIRALIKRSIYSDRW